MTKASLLQIIRDMEYNLDNFQPTDTEGYNIEGMATYDGQQYCVSCSNYLKTPDEVQIAEIIKKEIDEKAAAIDKYTKLYMTFVTNDIEDCENSIISHHFDYMTADEIEKENKAFTTDYNNSTKIFNKTIYIDKEQMAEINHFLTDGEADDRLEEDDTISHTVIFDNGYQMDIKCCGTQYEDGEDNTAWTEAVLFNPNGGEEDHTDISDEYSGEWETQDADGNIYRVEVKTKELANEIINPSEESLDERDDI